MSGNKIAGPPESLTLQFVSSIVRGFHLRSSLVVSMPFVINQICWRFNQ